MNNSKNIWRNVFILTLVGGLAFWLANFAISLTSIAAEYRAILSIAYYPMLFESLIGGLVIGLCLSFLLIRFHDRIPTKNSMLKSLLFSMIILVISTILLQGPSSLHATGDGVMRSFFLGALFNAIRIPALGLSIGWFYSRLNKGTDLSENVSLSAQAK